MFDAINTAGSGLASYHTWLDVIADNIANMNDTAPTSGKVFATHYAQAGEIANGPDGVGGGVQIVSVTEGDTNGVLTQAPNDPMADAQGYVRSTDVNLSEQMGDMIVAQRAYQANANVIDRAKATYEAALSIGKGV
jgi:flagellar basal-body rod protein FlgC